MDRLFRRAAAGLAVGVAWSATAQVFDFNALVHGEIIADQFEPALTITGTNPNRAFDIVAAFDTERIATTADPDLQGPPWLGGNLAVSETEVAIGRALIIAQNNRDIDHDGVLDAPNDEASRPAGTIDLAFASAMPCFGFDIVDIEGVMLEGSALDFYLGGMLLGSVDFTEFVDPLSAYYDPTVQFGDRTANRIRPILAADFGALGFDRVVINVGGSSAYDTFVVPAPASALLFGAGALGVLRRRR